jgi:hypothetical protein
MNAARIGGMGAVPKKTSNAAIKAISLSALAGLTPAVAAESSSPPRQVTQNWIVEKTSPNDVGCSRTTIAKPHEGNESRVGYYLFDRPSNLNVESLSDKQLESCGLPPLKNIRNFPKTSKEYQGWLSLAHGLMNARQLDPRYPAPLPYGYPPAPPLFPTGGPPKPYPFDHVFNGRPSSVAPGGYSTSTNGNFAAKEIVGDDSINTGEAASPMAQATWFTPTYRLAPAT